MKNVHFLIGGLCLFSSPSFCQSIANINPVADNRMANTTPQTVTHDRSPVTGLAMQGALMGAKNVGSSVLRSNEMSEAAKLVGIGSRVSTPIGAGTAILQGVLAHPSTAYAPAPGDPITKRKKH